MHQSIPLVQDCWWQQAEEHGTTVLRHVEQFLEGASSTPKQCSRSLYGPRSICRYALAKEDNYNIGYLQGRGPARTETRPVAIGTLDGHASLAGQPSNSMITESDAKAVLMSEPFAHIFRLDLAISNL